MKTLLAGICVLAFAAPHSAGQTSQPQAPPRPPSNNFARMFPHPTSNNAFEDFVRAGDGLANSDAWQEFEKAASAGPTTLAAKRAILYNPAVRDALDAVRVGLQKPIASPYGDMDDETLLPELRTFRSMGRLFSTMEYVQLADGKVESALDTLFEALRFGYASQQGAFINGLVSLAVDAQALRQIETHVDQLSVRDCGRLVQLVTDWMQKPDPARALIAVDEKSMLKVLKKYRNDPMRFYHALGDDNDTSDAGLKERLFYDNMAQNPEQAGLVFDDAAKIVAGTYNYELANLSLPYWQRQPAPPVPDNAGPAAQVAKQLGGADIIERVSERYAREMAEIQLLGVYAAVMQYRWENDRLPASLSSLHLGDLIIDPFSGQPFTYKPLDSVRFELTGIGPLDRSTDPAPPAGQRIGMVMPIQPAH